MSMKLTVWQKRGLAQAQITSYHNYVYNTKSKALFVCISISWSMTNSYRTVFFKKKVENLTNKVSRNNSEHYLTFLSFLNGKWGDKKWYVYAGCLIILISTGFFRFFLKIPNPEKYAIGIGKKQSRFWHMFWNFQMNSYDAHQSMLNWKWYPKTVRNLK